MAALVVARHFQIELPFYGTMPEPHLPRVSGPLGNPTYLAVYMLSNVAIALGLAARSWVPVAAAAAGAAPEPRAGGAGADGRGRRAAKVRAGRRASRRQGQAPRNRGAIPVLRGMVERHALERARELAPNREVFPRRLRPPASLEVRRRDDGRHVLHWRPSEGAGYHQLGEKRDGGVWHLILHAYDPARTSFVVPGSRGPGTWRYQIGACRYPGHCSAVTQAPPLTVSDGEAGRNRGGGESATNGPGQ